MIPTHRRIALRLRDSSSWIVLGLVAILSDPAAAQAGCSVTGTATVISCDATYVQVNAGQGSVTLTVDGVTTGWVELRPDPGLTSGSFDQTLILTGDTTLNRSGYSAVVMQSSLANRAATVIIDSGVEITSTDHFGAVWVRNDTSGDITIRNAGTIHTSGTGDSPGITATTNLGGVAITNTGTVVAATGRGIYADGGFNDTSDVLVTVTNSGSVSAYQAGIRVINYKGLAAITNSGTVATASRQGLVAWSSDGDVSITNSGTVSAGDDNAVHAMSETGDVTVLNSGFLTAADNTGLTDQGTGHSGIVAEVGTIGSIRVTNAAGATITAAAGLGITATTAQGSVTITNQGVISARTGIAATSSSGAVSLVNSGTISGSSLGVSLNGTTNTLSNSGVIAGDITAAGTLTVSGGDGVMGTLQGQGGGIGTMTAASVLFSGGSLLLRDSVQGNAVNAASLRVDDTVAISGNYSQTSGGSLVIGVTSATTYGTLVVAGTATLDSSGSVSLLDLGGSTLAVGQSYTIVSAGTLSADGVSVVAVLPTTTSIVGNSLVATLGRWASLTPTDGDTSGAAAALDHLAGQSAYQSMLLRLSALSAGGRAHALKQLGSTQLTPQLNVSTVVVQPVSTAVGGRQTAALATTTGAAAGSEPAPSGWWGQMLGGVAERDQVSGADGYSAVSYGLLIGADTHVSRDAIAGLAFSWLRGDATGKGDSAGNQTVLDNFQITAYGSWRPGLGPLHVEAQAGLGRNEYDQSRAIDYLGQTASARYGGWQYQAKIGGGYDIAVGAVTVTPLATLQWIRIENESYQEQGADVANLSVARVGFNAVDHELGARITGGFDTRLGPVTTEARAAWVHDYLDAPLAIAATMGGQGFVSTTARTAGDGARLGLAATLERDDGLSLRLDYQADLREDYRGHTGLMKVRQEF